ncbi:hypothetical protein FOZ60_008128 [Perkinsus olseni]|uniref:Uncharacterized protein n=1 Tax=Perkinsus olseni TaxID=32597 RepID=A0A7J6NK10_PEROL|nr:hypothetical protein FOZ60_008128 [Perkinsus olseni]
MRLQEGPEDPVLGQEGGLRALKGPPMLSCVTPTPYGTVCRDASCFVTPHGDQQHDLSRFLLQCSISLYSPLLHLSSLAWLRDEHAWLVPSSGTAFDDSSEYIDEGGLGGMKNESGLPGPYDRPTGTCALSSYDVIGCHCKKR